MRSSETEFERTILISDGSRVTPVTFVDGASGLPQDLIKYTIGRLVSDIEIGIYPSEKAEICKKCWRRIIMDNEEAKRKLAIEDLFADPKKVATVSVRLADLTTGAGRFQIVITDQNTQPWVVIAGKK